MTKNTLLILLGLIVVAGVVAATQFMGKKPASEVMEEAPQVEASAAPVEATGEVMTEGSPVAMSDLVEVNMQAGAFYYEPNTIKAKKGQTVKITFNSVDMMHDFNIDELNVKSPIVKSGETATVEFVADQVGTFEYYCSVGQHRQNGQVGTLVVEE